MLSVGSCTGLKQKSLLPSRTPLFPRSFSTTSLSALCGIFQWPTCAPFTFASCLAGVPFVSIWCISCAYPSLCAPFMFFSCPTYVQVVSFWCISCAHWRLMSYFHSRLPTVSTDMHFLSLSLSLLLLRRWATKRQRRREYIAWTTALTMTVQAACCTGQGRFAGACRAI